MKLFRLLLATALVGCAGTFDAPPKAPVRTEEPTSPEAPKLQVVDRPGWSATLPSQWLTLEHPAEVEVMYRSPDKLGRGPIMFAAAGIKLEADQKPEDFGGGVVLATMSVGRVKVVAAEPRTISGKPGSAMVFITSSGIAVIQYSVGSGNRGYSVRCGGDINEIETVAKICEPILDSFKLK